MLYIYSSYINVIYNPYIVVLYIILIYKCYIYIYSSYISVIYIYIYVYLRTCNEKAKERTSLFMAEVVNVLT